MSVLAQQLVLGVLVGGLYGLAAAGLSLVFGVLKVLNVAHGELIMLGGYGAFWLFACCGVGSVTTGTRLRRPHSASPASMAAPGMPKMTRTPWR